MVLDTQDAVPVEAVRQRIGSAQALQGRRYEVDELSQLAASLNSISMTVTVVDKPRGAASMQFGSDATIVDTFGKGLFLEALDNRGMRIDDPHGWLNKYADKVDGLPRLDVDPTMLDYSSSVSKRFREASAALQNIGMQSGALKAQISGTTISGGTTSYGFYYHSDVDPRRRAIYAQARAAGVSEAKGIVQSIKEDTATIRKEMTQKYQIEF